MVEIFANSGDPDQTPHSAASDLDLHCLPVTRLGVSSLQRVKVKAMLLKNLSEAQDIDKSYNLMHLIKIG